MNTHIRHMCTICIKVSSSNTNEFLMYLFLKIPMYPRFPIYVIYEADWGDKVENLPFHIWERKLSINVKKYQELS